MNDFLILYNRETRSSAGYFRIWDKGVPHYIGSQPVPWSTIRINWSSLGRSVQLWVLPRHCLVHLQTIWYQVGVSRIPKSQAVLMVNRTIAIPGDEGNHVLILNVFHLLHCLVSDRSISASRSISSKVHRTSWDRLYILITIPTMEQRGLITTSTVSIAFGNP